MVVGNHQCNAANLNQSQPQFQLELSLAQFSPTLFSMYFPYFHFFGVRLDCWVGGWLHQLDKRLSQPIETWIGAGTDIANSNQTNVIFSLIKVLEAGSHIVLFRRLLVLRSPNLPISYSVIHTTHCTLLSMYRKSSLTPKVTSPSHFPFHTWWFT